MCGRYTLTINDLGELESYFFSRRELPVDWTPRYNAAPSQVMPVIIAGRQPGDPRILTMMRWGLVPFWAKDPTIGSRLINARLERLDEKPSFRYALHKRRCLVPADGYYEWQKSGRSKMPYRIVRPDQSLFALAGLWEQWEDGDGKTLNTFAIITTEPVAAVREIHNRMPLILPRDREEEWLSHMERDQLKKFLHEIKAEENLKAYRVSPLVNRPDYDGPECINETA